MNPSVVQKCHRIFQAEQLTSLSKIDFNLRIEKLMLSCFKFAKRDVQQVIFVICHFLAFLSVLLAVGVVELDTE